jgi:Ohr subfamily peroxiredoxin
MFGSDTTADHVVQETYRRWYALDQEERAAIAVPRAWLTRTAGSICLELLAAPDHVPGGPVTRAQPVPGPASHQAGYGQAMLARHDLVARRFAAACQAGDPEALREVLAADAIVVSDGGGKVRVAVRPTYGADAVARVVTALLIDQPGTELAIGSVNGRTGLVLRRSGKAVAVVSVSVAGAEVTAVWIILNPDKLQRWLGERQILSTDHDYNGAEFRPLYSTRVAVTGGSSSHGRASGHARSSDGTLSLELRMPDELGGDNPGPNPEQLFAAGYAACFHGALSLLARRHLLDPAAISVEATVAFGRDPADGGYQLRADLVVNWPGADAAALVRGGAAPHPVRLAGFDGPGQALHAHRAALADPPGERGVPGGQALPGERVEKLGVAVEAGPAVCPAQGRDGCCVHGRHLKGWRSGDRRARSGPVLPGVSGYGGRRRRWRRRRRRGD